MKKRTSHLDDFLEWQKYQYFPGHYIGGNIHPFHKWMPKWLVKILLVVFVAMVLSPLLSLMFGKI